MSESTEHRFYEYLGFSTEHSKNVTRFYLRFFAECDTVLDVACGRGEFLQLLTEAGKTATGIDLDPGMVRQAQAAGLDVIEGDVFDFLGSGERSFDGIYFAHFIEHLDGNQAAALLKGCYRSLNDGGVLVVAAPNPACLDTVLHEFWRDPSHVRMFDLSLLKFLLADEGFEVIESGANKNNQAGSPADVNNLDRGTATPLDELRLTRRGGKTAGNRARSFLNRLFGPGNAEIDDLKQDIELLSKNNEIMNRNLEAVRDALQKTVTNLYPPNEIYVAAKKVKTKTKK